METSRAVKIAWTFMARLMAVLAVLGLSACGDDDASVPPDATIAPLPGDEPRIFVPRLEPSDGSDEIWRDLQRTTLMWFGRVDSHQNHVEARLGYGEHQLLARLAVFDRQIYDDAPDADVQAWDSVTLLVDFDGDDAKDTVDDRSFMIAAQAHRQSTDQTAVYRGANGAWTPSALPVLSDLVVDPDIFVASKGYRGEDRDHSRGWHVTFLLGWGALGLPGAPLEADGRVWRVAVIATDRDDDAGTLGGGPQSWPDPTVDPLDPSTWGRWELLDGHFLSWSDSGSSAGAGQPAYAIAWPAPEHVAGTEETITIRQGLGDTMVENASVGASEVLCSGDDDYNFGDGPNSWGGNTERSYLHVQNQGDYADWPCFARLYLKFPLADLPTDKVVLAAALRLHHKQPTSAGAEGERSLIQAFWVGDLLQDGQTPWTTANITWNTAPIALENLAGCWGDRTGNMDVGWDALPAWTWDVTRAVARRATDGAAEVSFALASADTDYHTGKEFVRSDDFADWGDPTQRPTLDVLVAEPAP